MANPQKSTNLPVTLGRASNGFHSWLNRTVTATNDFLDGTGHSGAQISTARRPVMIGFIIIVVAFFGFGLWALLAPISSAVLAQGTIAAESGHQTIQHLEGGIVKEIPVHEGSEVKAGDVLLRLDGTRARAELGLIEGQYFLAIGSQARLNAERDGLAKPVFSAELIERAKTDPAVADIMTGQLNLFEARAAVLKGQESILQQQIAQYQKQIDGYSAIEGSKRAQSKLVKSELTDISSLLEEGYVTRSRVLALQREAAQLDGEHGQVLAEMSRAQQGIGEANRQILQLQNQRREEVSKDLRSVESQLDDLGQRRIAMQDVVNRLEVKSPMDGTVVNLNFHTIGGVISPSTPLMEIVPANDTLMVDAEINPRDIDTVRIGQEVSLRISTSDARITPVIYGRLEQIAQDRTPDPHILGGRGTYRIRVSIPPNELARLGTLKLHVGMPVEALVSNGSQTAFHYAVKPLTDAFAKSFRER